MTLTELRDIINSLSYFDKRVLLEGVQRSVQSHSIQSELEEQRFADGLHCNHCGCVENIQKYGKKNGVQRYRCKDCGRIFTAHTNTLLSKTHKSLAVWERYIECMLDGFSLAKSADECGISVRTAFIWRHKILDALSMKREKDVTLKGVVEADETFFRVSYKGSKHLPEGRSARKRGVKASKRGLSLQQICVPCAMDRNGAVVSKVCNLGKISMRELLTFYAGKVEEGATFCTDSEKSYRGFAEKMNIRLIQIESGKHRNGVYHINHINAYHSKLKNFMRGFKGVSSKYLNNYLTWNCVKKMSVSDVLFSVVKQNYNVATLEVTCRPAIPLLLNKVA